MTNSDVVSMALAGVALVLAAAMAVLMLVSVRRRGAETSSAPQPLAVRLVPSAGTDLDYWWRFETAADAPPTAIDIFSFRSHGEDQSTPWQHELMDAALILTPGEPAYLRARTPAIDGAAYDVSVGWTVRRGETESRASAIMTVEPEPSP